MSNPNLLQDNKNIVLKRSSDYTDDHVAHIHQIHSWYHKQYNIASLNFYVLWYCFYCVRGFPSIDHCGSKYTIIDFESYWHVDNITCCHYILCMNKLMYVYTRLIDLETTEPIGITFCTHIPWDSESVLYFVFQYL